MDTDALVGLRFEEGERFVKRLITSGFDVTAAFWARESDVERWYLYIVSKAVAESGEFRAYREANTVLRSMSEQNFTTSDLKLVAAASPIAQEVLEILRQSPIGTPIRVRKHFLGDVAIQDAWIYPTFKPAEILAKGKEEVLRYLEEDAVARAGTSGEYVVVRDSAGKLAVSIAGHLFVGDGAVDLGDKKVQVSHGIVVDIK
jgi:hypothetical protein